MKTWIEFLPHKTNVIKRKAKILNALAYEVEEAKFKAEYLENVLDKFTKEIENLAIKLNSKEEIKIAKKKAQDWNNNLNKI